MTDKKIVETVRQTQEFIKTMNQNADFSKYSHDDYREMQFAIMTKMGWNLASGREMDFKDFISIGEFLENIEYQ